MNNNSEYHTFKLSTIIVFVLLTTAAGFTQVKTTQEDRKGKLYFYWGWNRGWFSDSDINFSGDNYNFTLKNVVAKDRLNNFNLNTYLNPTKATIPQYNFRVGYYITNNYSISFGIDHMKYIVEQDQFVKISGSISNTETEYDGIYSEEHIQIKGDFLKFEHTNGLNYINIGFRRIDEIFYFNNIGINLTEGLDAGILFPKTNTTLIIYDRYDEFHLAGYGINGVVAINVSFFDSFFIQSEFKGGFINLPDIRTTSSESDRASQNFFFYQLNLVFGATIKL